MKPRINLYNKEMNRVLRFRDQEGNEHEGYTILSVQSLILNLVIIWKIDV